MTKRRHKSTTRSRKRGAAERLHKVEADIEWLKRVVDDSDDAGSLLEREIITLKEGARWTERAVWWLITTFVVSFVFGVGLVLLRGVKV